MRIIHLAFVLALIMLLGASSTLAATLVVLNKSEASASLLDPKTGREIARLPVGVGPHEAATSPDGKTVVVCNYGIRTPGSSLTVIDMEKQAAVKTIDLSVYHRPHGIVFLNDGERVVVTAEAEKKLIVVNIETGEVEEAIDTDQEISHMVTLTRNQRLAFVANIRSGSVSVIDLPKGELRKVIQTGEGAEGVFAHPTRSEVWVTNREANTVSIISTNTLDIVETLESGRFPIRVAITPNGDHALVSCARSGDVWVYDTDTRDVVATIPMDVQALTEEERQKRLFGDQFDESPVPVGILIEPDGKRAYVANTNADIVTVLDLEQWRVSGRLRAGKEPDGMAWVN